MADPADDLMAPMKGPLQTLRDGDAPSPPGDPARKSAQLLPWRPGRREAATLAMCIRLTTDRRDRRR
jgi:hypothetical protein